MKNTNQLVGGKKQQKILFFGNNFLLAPNFSFSLNVISLYRHINFSIELFNFVISDILDSVEDSDLIWENFLRLLSKERECFKVLR